MSLTENTWTVPSDWCPRPEWWHSADCDATEDEVGELVAALARAIQPEWVIETGAYLGHTSEKIGRALQANGHGRLIAVELLEDRARKVHERTADLPVSVVAGTSQQAFANFTGVIGLAFLDSDIDVRPLEFQWLINHLADGAVVVVHDTAPHHLASHPAFAEWIASMKPLNLRTPRGVVMFQVNIG